ncbi:hypothetical protein [Alkaliphilus sp. B6464]|uniref:hypothetical protein n=1 Tax=Alkaliphilus sp. B6464 TaxID=2731219 RepID=UPI001BAC7998|nr:hypothetical protein [Alkaliphilus sp. B6464]QUH21486.1 hypothetical protein HYG84_17420 [Alkaliphilus sp. B6464]
MVEVLKGLFKEISTIIKIEEIAYLSIEDGELIPIYKNDTEFLPLEKWINFHRKYRSFVKDSDFLIKLVETKTLCAIDNTNDLSSKPTEFKVLDIKSIYLFPVIQNNEVVGIVDIAFINKDYKLTQEQISQCEKIIDKNIDLLINN